MMSFGPRGVRASLPIRQREGDRQSISARRVSSRRDKMMHRGRSDYPIASSSGDGGRYVGPAGCQHLDDVLSIRGVRGRLDQASLNHAVRPVGARVRLVWFVGPCTVAVRHMGCKELNVTRGAGAGFLQEFARRQFQQRLTCFPSATWKKAPLLQAAAHEHVTSRGRCHQMQSRDQFVRHWLSGKPELTTADLTQLSHLCGFRLTAHQVGADQEAAWSRSRQASAASQKSCSRTADAVVQPRSSHSSPARESPAYSSCPNRTSR
jgi:hypothetical protein